MCGCVMDDASSKRIATSFAAIFRTSRTFVVRLFMLSALSLWSGAALAQAPTLEAKVREIQEEREWIHVAVNKSVLIETNVPITREQTLAPEIAELSSVSPTQVLVTGKSFGRTQVIIWADDQQMTFDVSVEQELGQLEEAIRRVAPHADVQAHPIMDTVVISGTVSDAHLADRIMQVAAIFASDVQNHLQIAGEQQAALAGKSDLIPAIKEACLYIAQCIVESYTVDGWLDDGSPDLPWLPSNFQNEDGATTEMVRADDFIDPEMYDDGWRYTWAPVKRAGLVMWLWLNQRIVLHIVGQMNLVDSSRSHVAGTGG